MRALALGFLAILAVMSDAQDRLPSMPRYDRYERLRKEIAGAIIPARLRPTFTKEAVFYAFNGKNFKLTLSNLTVEEIERLPAGASAPRGRRGPERGRQLDRVVSADGKRTAIYRDRNVWLEEKGTERALTTEGNAQSRLKFGQASWVYGEELGVREAMWFSPDGRYLAFYGFDESPVKDFFLTTQLTQWQSALDIEAYPKAGTTNPIVSLWVVNLETGEKVQVATSFGEASLGEYIYAVEWAPNGEELLFKRTNRKQNRMQWCGYRPGSASSRVLVEESWPASWAENHPAARWLSDKKRFLWVSERNGFKNIYLIDSVSQATKTLTRHACDVEQILAITPKEDWVYYTARSGASPYLIQLHRCSIKTGKDERLTDPQFHHNVTLAEDAKYFISNFENAVTPPGSALFDAKGKKLKDLAVSDTSKFKSLNLRAPERVQLVAADGKTPIWASLHFPSDFDEQKQYPLVVDVYGGPESGGQPETFRTPDLAAEFGFLILEVEGRGTNGRGKAFRDAVYGKLGVVEIDDQAAAVRQIATRKYVNGKRVGIYGTSYGGYASLMALLRHPDVFHAAVASSSVTDWRHYDTIYTERYMGLPDPSENLKGYDEGSANTYVKQLKGKLMLYYGTLDNNVHPNNTLMLAQKLNQAGKSYSMMVGPDQGHTWIGFARTWEFMIDHLMDDEGKSKLMTDTSKRLLARMKALPSVK